MGVNGVVVVSAGVALKTLVQIGQTGLGGTADSPDEPRLKAMV